MTAGNFLLNVVGIWLCENGYPIDKPAYPEKSSREKLQKSRADLALVEAVSAQKAEDKRQNKRNPFILRRAGVIYNRLRSVVDDNLRGYVLRALKLLNLPSAFHAQNRVHVNLLSAVFTEFHSRLKPVLKLLSVVVRINLDVA